MDKGHAGKSEVPRVQPESAEEMSGLKVTALDENSPESYWRAIRHLSYDVLDSTQDNNFEAMSRLDTDDLRTEYLESDKHGQMFVITDGDRVVGFLGLHVDLSSKVATVKTLRTAVPNAGEHELEEILDAAETFLRSSAHSVHIETPHARSELTEVLIRRNYYASESEENVTCYQKSLLTH